LSAVQIFVQFKHLNNLIVSALCRCIVPCFYIWQQTVKILKHHIDFHVMSVVLVKKHKDHLHKSTVLFCL